MIGGGASSPLPRFLGLSYNIIGAIPSLVRERSAALPRGSRLRETAKRADRSKLGRAALFIEQRIPAVRVPWRDRNMPSVSVRRCGADQRGTRRPFCGGEPALKRYCFLINNFTQGGSLSSAVILSAVEESRRIAADSRRHIRKYTRQFCEGFHD